jgi:hypothetical protein
MQATRCATYFFFLFVFTPFLEQIRREWGGFNPSPLVSDALPPLRSQTRDGGSPLLTTPPSNTRWRVFTAHPLCLTRDGGACCPPPPPLHLTGDNGGSSMHTTPPSNTRRRVLVAHPSVSQTRDVGGSSLPTPLRLTKDASLRLMRDGGFSLPTPPSNVRWRVLVAHPTVSRTRDDGGFSLPTPSSNARRRVFVAHHFSLPTPSIARIQDDGGPCCRHPSV